MTFEITVTENLNEMPHSFQVEVNSAELRETILNLLSRFELFGTFGEKLPCLPEEVELFNSHYSEDFIRFKTRLGRDTMAIEVLRK